jgi:hypothetical protein
VDISIPALDQSGMLKNCFNSAAVILPRVPGKADGRHNWSTLAWIKALVRAKSDQTANMFGIGAELEEVVFEAAAYLLNQT